MVCKIFHTGQRHNNHVKQKCTRVCWQWNRERIPCERISHKYTARGWKTNKNNSTLVMAFKKDTNSAVELWKEVTDTVMFSSYKSCKMRGSKYCSVYLTPRHKYVYNIADCTSPLEYMLRPLWICLSTAAVSLTNRRLSLENYGFTPLSLPALFVTSLLITEQQRRWKASMTLNTRTQTREPRLHKHSHTHVQNVCTRWHPTTRTHTNRIPLSSGFVPVFALTDVKWGHWYINLHLFHPKPSS